MTVQGPRYQFQVFFDRHAVDLGRLAYLLTGNRVAAEELTEEVFRAVWHRWSVIPAVETPEGYARRLMVDAVVDRRRRLVRQDRRALLAEARQVAAGGDPRAQASVAVRSALQSLPVRRRACVVLRRALGLSEAETAHALGISVRAVRRRASRGTAQLQKRLKPSRKGRHA